MAPLPGNIVTAMRRASAILVLYGGEVANIMALLLILATIARLGTPQELGQYHFALSLLAPIFMLLWMQQRTILASDHERRYPTRTYYYARSVAISAAVIISGLIGMLWGSSGFMTIFLIMLATKVVESYSDLNSGLFLRAGQPVTVSSFKIARALSSSLAFVLMYWLTGTLPVALTSVLFISLSVLAFEARTAWNIESSVNQPMPQASSMLALFRDTSALGLLEFLYSIQSNLPKYILMSFSGEAAVGIYASLVYMLRPAILFVTSGFQAALKKLSYLHSKDNEVELRRLLRQLIGLALAISASMTLVFALSGNWILGTAFGKQFSHYQNYLVLVSLNNFFALPAAMVSYYGIIRRRYRLQPLVVLSSIAANTGLSLILGQHYGEKGIVIGWILSGAVLLIGHSLVVRRPI